MKTLLSILFLFVAALCPAVELRVLRDGSNVVFAARGTNFGDYYLWSADQSSPGLVYEWPMFAATGEWNYVTNPVVRKHAIVRLVCYEYANRGKLIKMEAQDGLESSAQMVTWTDCRTRKLVFPARLQAAYRNIGAQDCLTWDGLTGRASSVNLFPKSFTNLAVLHNGRMRLTLNNKLTLQSSF